VAHEAEGGVTPRQERVARIAAKRPHPPRRPPPPAIVLLGPERDDPDVLDEVLGILSSMLDNPPAAGGG
jgi:hypothetical protein